MKAATFFAVCTALFLTPTAHAQTLGQPDPALVEQAKALVADSIFTRLNADQADALAEWVTDQTHSDASGVTRMQQLSQFQSQFRMIAASGPSNPFGEMDGFDLLQQSSLPGTDRYFRLTYMTYHDELPLVWEFHFYARPDGGLSMPYLQFSGQNPFTYLSTPDMLIERYYDLY